MLDVLLAAAGEGGVSAWGEGAWTARDMAEAERPFVVRDFEGRVHGRRETEAEAVRLRDARGAEGIECWVEAPRAPAYIVDRDPGDEDDNRRATC